MSLTKLGSHTRMIKTAAVAEEVLVDQPIENKPVATKIIEAKNSDFLYYRARAISAGDQGPLQKDGTRGWNFNGNKDYFPRTELEAAYQTFVGRNIFLDHNSESSLYSSGKIIDALPIDDKETGEYYIELLGKIDRTLHPEICRKIETGELNSTSMGCSVDESICSICGTVLHSDADEKCKHMSMGLGKEFPAETDMPEYNIKQGDLIPCFSINKGIVFNEDSIVGVPADPTAVIKTVLSNVKSQMSRTGSLTKKEQIDLTAQMEKVFSKLDPESKLQLQASLSGIFPTVEKESSMADKNVINDETKKILNKISAYEMEQLESYVTHKTKKANDIASQEIVADAVAKEETFLSKIVAKVKNALAAESKEAARSEGALTCHNCGKATSFNDFLCDGCFNKGVPGLTPEQWPMDFKTLMTIRPEMMNVGKRPTVKKTKPHASAKFTEDKNNVLDSTWAVREGDETVLEASLKEIWGSQFELLSFDDQRWATSDAYATEILARYNDGGVTKLASDWDVENKLSKTAADPKLGPSGVRLKPSTGISNREHHYKTNLKFDKPGQEKGQKGPAAPKCKEVRDSKVEMPGQEKGQTGPAAEKSMKVKTDYSDPKPEAVGKELKNAPKNPEEKKLEKTEKDIKTDYVAAGAEAMAAEDKWEKKEDKKSSLISWTSLTSIAQASIKTAAKKYIQAGMKNADAVAQAHSEFITQETDMKKQAFDKQDESVDGTTIPSGTKTMGDKVDESVDGTTVPGGAKPSSAPETSAQCDKERKTPNLTKAPDEAVDGTTLPPQGKKDEESVETSTHSDSKKSVGTEPEMAVKEAAKKEAATEMPIPEDKGGLEDIKVEEKPLDMPAMDPMAAPVIDEVPATGSVFDTTETLDIGDGYSARKDKETNEVIVEKDGAEVKRLPDGFSTDMAVVLPLMKAVLGLPPEAAAEAPDVIPPVDVNMEEPKSEMPGMGEAHEDELEIKESALNAKEAVLLEKESAIIAKEAAIVATEKAQRFASVLTVRTERCKKIISTMVEKDAIQMNKEVYQSEMQIGTYLIDAQKKAFEHAINAKQKELLAMDDNALLATEKVIADLKTPSTTNSKKASHIYVSPSFGEQLSEDQELKKIFDTFGNSKRRPQ